MPHFGFCFGRRISHHIRRFLIMKENMIIFRSEQIFSLRRILREMTISEYSDRSESKIIKSIFRLSRPFAILSMALFSGCIIAVAFLDQVIPFDLRPWIGWAFLAVLFFVVLNAALLFVEILRKSWLPYRKRYDQLLNAFRWYSIRDIKFLIRLLEIDVSVLELGLLQYRHQWIVLKRKMQFWFIPFAPSYLSLWWKPIDVGVDNNAIIVFYPLLAGLTFYIANQRQRPNQVILLLEYAIRLKSWLQKGTAEPEHSVGLRERLGRIFK